MRSQLENWVKLGKWQTIGTRIIFGKMDHTYKNVSRLKKSVALGKKEGLKWKIWSNTKMGILIIIDWVAYALFFR